MYPDGDDFVFNKARFSFARPGVHCVSIAYNFYDTHVTRVGGGPGLFLTLSFSRSFSI